MPTPLRNWRLLRCSSPVAISSVLSTLSAKKGQGKSAEELHKLVEGGKKTYGGTELKGKTLGVVGLGAIGSLVAETGLMLGMKVLGYDPALSVAAAWRLSRDVERMENMQSLLAKSDIVTLHLPVLEATRNLINKELIESFKPGATLINLSREKVADTEAILSGLETGRIGQYLTDFPVQELMGNDKVVPIPHLGASTEEAEENCAIMVADQLIDFLENGNIMNSVNFPNITLERNGGYPYRLLQPQCAEDAQPGPLRIGGSGPERHRHDQQESRRSGLQHY